MPWSPMTRPTFSLGDTVKYTCIKGFKHTPMPLHVDTYRFGKVEVFKSPVNLHKEVITMYIRSQQRQWSDKEYKIHALHAAYKVCTPSSLSHVEVMSLLQADSHHCWQWNVNYKQQPLATFRLLG